MLHIVTTVLYRANRKQATNTHHYLLLICLMGNKGTGHSTPELFSCDALPM